MKYDIFILDLMIKDHDKIKKALQNFIENVKNEDMLNNLKWVLQRHLFEVFRASDKNKIKKIYVEAVEQP